MTMLNITVELSFLRYSLVWLSLISYICIMKSVEGKTTDIRTIFRTEEFEEFYNSLNTRVKDKFEYTFGLVQTVYVLPVKYVKHLDGTDFYTRCVYLSAQMSIGRYYLRLTTAMLYYQPRESY